MAVVEWDPKTAEYIMVFQQIYCIEVEVLGRFSVRLLTFEMVATIGLLNVGT
jgi:hypothetical protein